MSCRRSISCPYHCFDRLQEISTRTAKPWEYFFLNGLSYTLVPEPSHVAEQRMSGLATYCALGIFSIVGHYIAMPSAAIFGVFFYLGIRNLNGNQLLMRIKMFFLPAKYRGNHKFLDIVSLFLTWFGFWFKCWFCNARLNYQKKLLVESSTFPVTVKFALGRADVKT